MTKAGNTPNEKFISIQNILQISTNLILTNPTKDYTVYFIGQTNDEVANFIMTLEDMLTHLRNIIIFSF